ncbi:hypothetical protein [Absidia glauca]|uniref:Uncharacterized protein n=1 Tax=Absidia glauca TaxID=4829 RepID=A0A168SWJ5_ABSGL|nr:hypothetical protein [Absidia glauca]
MTDVQVIKAIVKLPPKSRQSFALQNNNSSSNNNHCLPSQSMEHTQGNWDSYLVSNRLYVQVSASIAEHHILTLLQTCCPQDVHLTCQPYSDVSNGHITFANKDQADMAFTLFNGAHFNNGMRLSLSISPVDQACEPEPMSDILQVQHLPMDSSNQSIYDLFRPFGPMALCKIIVEQGPTAVFNGTALIQYYHSEDADHAISVMNNKMIQENIIAVFPFVFSKRQKSEADVDPGNATNKDTNTIDYTNLYIKNLDLNAKSSDLFKHFRKYGHIISARVMKNARTNQSKGFGFVSFIKSEEAYRALHGMNGRYILSKAILVNFHEPKKVRNNNDNKPTGPPLDSNGAPSPPSLSNTHTSSTTTTSTLSHMASSFSPPTPQAQYHHQPPQHYQPPSPVAPPYQPSPSLHKQYRQHYPAPQQKAQSQIHAPYHPPYAHITSEHQPAPKPSYKKPGSIGQSTLHGSERTGYRPTRDSVAKVEHTHSTPLVPSLSTLASGAAIQTPPPPRRTLRRRGSLESICSTMTETSHHTQRQRMLAAVLHYESTDLAGDIVDMLLTLKKKDRSLCLFNADFMKSKVQQAKQALATFDDDDDDDDDDDASIAAPQQQQHSALEIDGFLRSLEGLEMHEKKQKLGDRLFPCVKATGIKHAPKITIRLLDHVPLHDLAHLMYNDDDLRTKINQVTL